MGGFSLWHWLVVGIIILLLFGKGRFSDMMGDVAKGIKSFKKGITEDEEAEQQRRIAGERPVEPSPAPGPAPEPAVQPAPEPAARPRGSDSEPR